MTFTSALKMSAMERPEWLRQKVYKHFPPPLSRCDKCGWIGYVEQGHIVYYGEDPILCCPICVVKGRAVSLRSQPLKIFVVDKITRQQEPLEDWLRKQNNEEEAPRE